MFDAWNIVAGAVRAAGGDLVFEWPAHNLLWKQKCVKKMINRFKLGKVYFNGCMFGLPSIQGNYLFKLWMSCSTMPQIRKFKRTCSHTHKHDTTRGENATLSAYYTWEMTDLAHECFHERAATVQLKAIKPETKKHDTKEASVPDSREPEWFDTEPGELYYVRNQQMTNTVCDQEVQTSDFNHSIHSQPRTARPFVTQTESDAEDEKSFRAAGAKQTIKNTRRLDIDLLNDDWIVDSGRPRDLVGKRLAKPWREFVARAPTVSFNTVAGKSSKPTRFCSCV